MIIELKLIKSAKIEIHCSYTSYVEVIKKTTKKKNKTKQNIFQAINDNSHKKDFDNF